MNYRIEWIWPAAAIGALTLLTIPVVGAMLALAVVVIAVVAILAAVVGAIVAMPVLVARAVRRHRRSGRARPAYVAQAEAPAPVR
jgi:hypothetical protein